MPVADYDRLRRLFFLPVIAISAIASLSVAAGLHDNLLVPGPMRSVKAVVAAWAALHIPFVLLSRGRHATLVYEAFGYIAFAVLTLVFQNTIPCPFERLLAQMPMNYTILFLILLLLPLKRFLLFASVVCGAAAVMAFVQRGRFDHAHEYEAASSIIAQLAAQWAISVLVSSLLEWHRRHLTASRELMAGYSVQLQKEVAEQTATIRKQQEGVARAEKLRAIGVLAGGIAHDFNNKLTVLLGYCDMLAKRSAQDAVAVRWIGEMRRTSEQASAMTRQLLSFGRQEMIRPRVIDLGACVADRRDMITKVVGTRISLVVENERGTVNVRMDPGQVDQVLMNLVLNARDAMPNGGRLTIRTGASGRAGFALLSVGDTGTGMSAEVQSRLFEPFFTTKGPGEGAGLGLASVYGIIKQNNGEIAVSSEEGRGSVFEIRLPFTSDPPEAAGKPRKLAAAPAAHATILLVEDEPPLRALIRETLQDHGYTVVSARDGDEGLRVAASFQGPIDLLLSDVVTPGSPPDEVFEALRKARPGLRAIFMSGYADEAARANGLINGTEAFIPKPFSPSELLAAIARELDRQTNA